MLGSAIFSQTATVISENANLRGTPSQSGKVVETIENGTALEVIKQKGAWFLVQAADFVGWIHGDTIKYQEAADEGGMTPPRGAITQPRRVSSEAASTPSPVRSSGNYIRGPRGGCYYLNRNGNKTYVDRSLCR